VFALASVALSLPGCFRGDEREKQPPPGWPGGKCLAPDGSCQGNNICNLDDAYCYNPQDPCEGFFCGGSDRGMCMVMEALPNCECFEGFQKEQFPLYCCPDPDMNPMIDPLCLGNREGGGVPDGSFSGDEGETGAADLVGWESDF
jgi:hypothetical protein